MRSKNRNHDPIQLRVEALIKAGKTEEAEVLRLSDWKTFSVRPHDFRHSYCTMLRDAGTDLKLAMKWMGHADEKMILKIYDHVTDFRTEQALSTLEKMTSGSQMVVKQKIASETFSNIRKNSPNPASLRL